MDDWQADISKAELAIPKPELDVIRILASDSEDASDVKNLQTELGLKHK